MTTAAHPRPVRILILGTGSMAKSHVEAYAAVPGAEVVAGVDSRPEVLAEFCATHGIPNGFATLDEAIAWGGFDAVSNVTPDAAHYPTTMPLLAAGKHVLCEKPLATSHAEALAMAKAARAAGVANMVNLSYRHVVPALPMAAAMVADGVLGNLRHFEASYLQSWLTQPAWGDWRTDPRWLWRLSTEHGSKGVLGDVGIHILDFTTFAAGSMPADISCRLKTFAKAPGHRIGEYRLDANDSFVMQLELEDGAIGTISASRFAPGHHNDLRLRLFGDKGGMLVSYEDGVSRLEVCLGDDMLTGTWRPVETPKVPTIYQRFVDAARGDGPSDPDFARGAALQAVLDAAEADGLGAHD
jgi:predicted dehydrogenase